MPLIATKGAASAQGFGEFAQTTAPVYIEDVFSTYLYTGNGSSQTITNGIDLSTKGGLLWIKNRDILTYNHILSDTTQPVSKFLYSNSASALDTDPSYITARGTAGFTVGSGNPTNYSGLNFVSWTFREQPKFFDIVTYTGNGATNRAISHNLGSTPGCIMIKCTSSTASWSVWHRNIGTSQFLTLNTAAAATTDNTQFGGSPTSTTFTVAGGGAQIRTNQNGETYVAYLFAHNAGGFGLTGSDNVITCDSFATNGSGGTSAINLGYEPQWLMIKNIDASEKWYMWDIMRGWSQSSSPFLSPNTSAAETSAVPGGEGYGKPTATGFSFDNFALGASNTYIYIAIRRGPMKTPTSGTSVFAVTSFTGVDAAQTSNFPVDFVMNSENLTGATEWFWVDRLRGATRRLESSAANAEGSVGGGVWDSNTTVRISNSGNNYKRSYPMFRRAPGFFDVVCYTGTDTGSQAISHNLGVAPELMIVKRRNGAQDWYVYSATTGNTRTLFLNLTDAQASPSTGYWNNTSPTSTQFTVGSQINVSNTYVAYLFASVSGVSKVGSYTGNGSSVTVTTGFQPRFVMVKRYESTGNWITGNSALGLVSADEPALFINTRDTETTGQDWVDISSTGFTVNSTALNANVNTGTYIYLAIA